MSFDQIAIFAILFSTLMLFIFSHWRYDIVAGITLLAVALTNTIPSDRLFAGFGHPAVITVAAVLIISRGLQNSGLVDVIAIWVLKISDRPIIQLTLLMTIIVAISGFMNDVGALAILMPVAIQIARKSNRSPSHLLMPLAFGSLLGGLLTMIGTPPNIIIGTYRETANSPAFSMFDFMPVGLGVALAGLLYIVVLGHRLIPFRKMQGSTEELFHIKDYTTEVRIPEKSKFVGASLSNLEALAESDLTIIGLVRGERRQPAPSSFETLWANDILIVEASPDSLKTFIDSGHLELVGSEEEAQAILKSEEVEIFEVVITPRSNIVGKNAKSLHLRWRYGINLLGVARHGERVGERLARVRFEVGDILLLQGPKESLNETLPLIGCLPLAHRELRLGQPRRIILSLGIFACAIGLTVSGFFPVQIAFTAAAIAMVLTNLLSLKQVYEGVDWPVIVLLGAMIPLGEAMEVTGGAKLIGNSLVSVTDGMPPYITLGLLLIITMGLSNVMNNAAVAVLMAPIAMNIALQLGAIPDAFLMTVAVGASSTFLTPIGHQSNALVMGPGGYGFGDYWQMGLPLSIIIVAVGIPLILRVWPLYAS